MCSRQDGTRLPLLWVPEIGRWIPEIYIETFEAAVTDLDRHLGDALRPFRAAISLLTSMPGLSDTAARVIVAEIGVDMARFPTAGHLVSWAGLCPRLDARAGKRHATRTRHGAPWLKTTLVQAAWGATRKKGSYLQAQFLRLKSRRGPKKAILAVAASMLTAAYFMLRDGVEYRDLGLQYFTHRDKEQIATAHSTSPQSRPQRGGDGCVTSHKGVIGTVSL